jgi:hypothetical protein
MRAQQWFAYPNHSAIAYLSPQWPHDQTINVETLARNHTHRMPNQVVFHYPMRRRSAFQNTIAYERGKLCLKAR